MKDLSSLLSIGQGIVYSRGESSCLVSSFCFLHQIVVKGTKVRKRSQHPTLVLANDDSGKEVQDEGGD